MLYCTLYCSINLSGGRFSGVLDLRRPIRPRAALIASLRHVEPHDTAIYIHAHRHEPLRGRRIPHREGAIKGDEVLFSRDRPAVIVSRMIRPSAWLPSASSARWLQPALVGSMQAKLVSRLQRRHGRERGLSRKGYNDANSHYSAQFCTACSLALARAIFSDSHALSLVSTGVSAECGW